MFSPFTVHKTTFLPALWACWGVQGRGRESTGFLRGVHYSTCSPRHFSALFTVLGEAFARFARIYPLTACFPHLSLTLTLPLSAQDQADITQGQSK